MKVTRKKLGNVAILDKVVTDIESDALFFYVKRSQFSDMQSLASTASIDTVYAFVAELIARILTVPQADDGTVNPVDFVLRSDFDGIPADLSQPVDQLIARLNSALTAIQTTPGVARLPLNPTHYALRSDFDELAQIESMAIDDLYLRVRGIVTGMRGYLSSDDAGIPDVLEVSNVLVYFQNMLKVLIDNGATLTADDADWGNGKSVFVVFDTPSAFALSPNIHMVGFGQFPVNSHVQATAWRVDGDFFINPITATPK